MYFSGMGLIGPGTITCEGEITATFTWAEDYVGEPPPDKVLVARYSSATFSASSNPGTGSGNRNNDLGHTPSGNTQEGWKYEPVDNPGASFTVKCSPSATATGNVSAGAYVIFRAIANPLEVNLAGGIGEPHNKKYLIGQKVTATITNGGLTPTSHSWSVSGGEPFKSWTADNNSSSYTGMGSETDTTLEFHFRKPTQSGAKAIVTCTTHLEVPAGALPAAGLDFTLSRQCVAEKPFNSLSVDIGTVLGAPIGNPNTIILYGGTINGNTGGIVWDGTVTTPQDYTLVYSNAGGWNYTQIVTTHRVFNGIYGPSHESLNGSLVLDTTYPYEPYDEDNPTPELQYVAGGQNVYEGDTPSDYLAYPRTYVDILDSFVTYTMYTPPGDGSATVPLKSLIWYWEGEATPNFLGIWTVFNTNAEWSFQADFPVHPYWTNNIINSIEIP